MDVKKFVPGHGKVVDKQYLAKSLDYFIRLKVVMENLKSKNVPKEKLLSNEQLPSFYEEKVPNFMNRVLEIWYDEIEPNS